MINRTTTHHDTDTGDFEVSCDVCNEFVYYDDLEWDDLLEAMKLDGWKSVKSNADANWQNRCPKCANLSLRDLERMEP